MFTSDYTRCRDAVDDLSMERRLVRIHDFAVGSSAAFAIAARGVGAF
jgi:hypothetical protein